MMDILPENCRTAKKMEKLSFTIIRSVIMVLMHTGIKSIKKGKNY